MTPTWESNFAYAWREKRIAKFEEKVVDIMLDHYGLRHRWRQQLLVNHKNRYNTWALTLEDFRDTFTFPVRLSVSTMGPVIKQHPVSKLFSGFASLPLAREFRLLRNAAVESSPVGLVVKWNYFRGALVLHELDPGPGVGPRFEFPSTETTGALTLQPLPDFLDVLAWSPSP